jgi:hypothetical protein
MVAVVEVLSGLFIKAEMRLRNTGSGAVVGTSSRA